MKVTLQYIMDFQEEISGFAVDFDNEILSTPGWAVTCGLIPPFRMCFIC